MRANIPKGMGGGPANMNQLMQQAQKMQERLEKLNVELEEKTHEISAGGGLVNLTINGKYEISGLTLDESVVDKDDIELLCDLVTEAVNTANKTVTEFGDAERERLGLNI